MGYLQTPLKYEKTSESCLLSRSLPDGVTSLDNLVELIVFTPKGSFTSDPDFGFEYWNFEYANVHFRDFNNGQESFRTGASRQVCEDSVKRSLAVYAPMLKDVNVSVILNLAPIENQRKRRAISKYEVVVQVSGQLDDGMETRRPYSSTVRFLMEPTVKKR